MGSICPVCGGTGLDDDQPPPRWTTGGSNEMAPCSECHGEGEVDYYDD